MRSSGAIDVSRLQVESYTTESELERSPRHIRRLLTREIQDLRDLWTGIGLTFGVRSNHGALENRLLLAPPRERSVSDPILEELDRQGGRCCEGLLLRLVAFDKHGCLRGHGVPGEIRRALKKLVRDGVVERVPLTMPEVPPTMQWDDKMKERVPGRTYAEQRRIDDWTGFEIRRSRTPKLATKGAAPTREERWRKQDEAIERELHVCHGNETLTSVPYDPPEDARRPGAARAYRALSRISDRQAEILRVFYGQRHDSEAAALDVVRGLVGGSTANAITALDDACKAYQKASNQ